MSLALSLIAALALAAPAAHAAPPTIESASFSEVTTDAVTLQAQINPQNKTTLYRFEYGPADCSANPCTSIPVPEGKLTAGSEAVAVSERIEGLTPGAAYHFRVIAHSSGTGGGEAVSQDTAFATYLAPPLFGPCPNDSLRTENPAAAKIEHSSAHLPDCRAYEQASPVQKNGGDLTGTVPMVRAALSGGAISFLSSSGIPGGVGAQELPSYLATRGTDEWSTSGTLPPADAGHKAVLQGWTPDFEEVFSRVALFGNPLKRAFLMIPKGGAPIEIVGYTPNFESSFAGATEGAAQVLFESKTALPGVPGALAGSSNLYLWDKASEQIRLAGVMNDGQAPPAGAFAGPYDWTLGTNPQTLGRGGAARDYYTQEENVLSKDGKVVYFTAAGSGKLYLRRNPTQPQSALDGEGDCTEAARACTVEVSATQKTNGTIPSGADPAGARPAAFMGASKDGSLSFFTSSEKLTNDANTGPEQEPAQIERANLTDEPPLPAALPNALLTHASDVEADSTFLYWINSETGAIMRAKLNGTEVQELIGPQDTDNLKGIALAGEFIYWANAAEEKGEGTIGRAKLGASGAEETDPDFLEEAGNPHDVALQGEYLYWTNSGIEPSTEAYVGRAKAADGSEAQPQFVTVDVFEKKKLWGIATDAEHLYFVMRNNQGEERIHRVDLDGDPESYIVQFIFLGLNVEAKDVALQGDHIYFSTQANNLIGRAKLNGAGLPSEVELNWIEDASHPQGIALDSEHLYWSANGESLPNPGNDLYRYDAESGELTDIAVDSAAPAGAEVRGVLGTSDDGSYVYYAANGVPDGTLNTPNARGEEAEAGECPDSVLESSGAQVVGTCNLYLAHAGQTTFIARLQVGGGELENDATNWDASASSAIFATTNFEKTARVSSDGQTLLFRSKRPLSGYQSKGTPQIYRYRAGDAGPTCVSCNPTGEAPLLSGSKFGAPGFGNIFPSAIVPANPAATLAHNLSEDGNRVFFETPQPLVLEDTNHEGGCPLVGSATPILRACMDVYEWEAQGTGSCEAERAVAEGGCLYLLSTGQGQYPAQFADASADGSDAYFFSRSRLAGQDEDQLLDVYDARVLGGLAAQNQPPPPVPCEAEGCKGPASARPEPSSPGSAAFQGPGNAVPRCARGKVRRSGRCVKKRRHVRHRKGNHRKGGRR